MSPMIGVCPLFDARSSRIWMRSEYLQAVEEVGGVPVVLPLTDKRSTVEALLDRLDGFLLTGGQDVDPAIYGQKKSSLCGEIWAERSIRIYLLSIPAWSTIWSRRMTGRYTA